MLMVAELEVESKVGPGLQTLTTMKQRSGGLEALACPLSQRQDGCGEDIYFLREQCLNWKDILCYSIQKKKHMIMDSTYKGFLHDH